MSEGGPEKEVCFDCFADSYRPLEDNDPLLTALLRKYQETVTYMGLVKCDYLSTQGEPLLLVTQQRVYLFERSIPKKQLVVKIKPSPNCIQSFHLFCLIRITCTTPERILLRFVSQVNTTVYTEVSIYSKHSVEISVSDSTFLSSFSVSYN